MKKNLLHLLISFLVVLSACNREEQCCRDLKVAKSEIKALKIIIDDDISSYDSLKYVHENLEISCDELVIMYDSLQNQPPDTFIFVPQCTLCYEAIDSVGGTQFYVGYDGRRYRLYQEEDTIHQVFYEFEKDTIVKKYRFIDETIYLDSIVTDGTGAKIIWSHTLCDKYLGDSCGSRLVLGHVLTGSSPETNEISFMIVDGISFNDMLPAFPPIDIVVNGIEHNRFTHDGKRYTGMLYHGYGDINSIDIIPELSPGDDMMIRDVILNNLRLNDPNGWNVSIDDSIQYLGNTYFIMTSDSYIRFEKP